MICTAIWSDSFFNVRFIYHKVNILGLWPSRLLFDIWWLNTCKVVIPPWNCWVNSCSMFRNCWFIPCALYITISQKWRAQLRTFYFLVLIDLFEIPRRKRWDQRHVSLYTANNTGCWQQAAESTVHLPFVYWSCLNRIDKYFLYFSSISSLEVQNSSV